MKKILSKKLQLRSTTIALLTGRGLGIVKGGVSEDTVDDGGGGLGTTSGLPICEPAGNGSRNDPDTNPHPCHMPIDQG
jgi:hypothetical protein